MVEPPRRRWPFFAISALGLVKSVQDAPARRIVSTVSSALR
jgi:hypothetical protein